MIISNQELAVHLGCLRNLTSYTSGRYALRVSLSEEGPRSSIQATPVSVIQRYSADSENRSQCNQEEVTTRVFSMKSAADVEIDEIYIFKLDSPLTSKDEYHLKLTIDLIQVESDTERVIGNYNASINGQAQHQYLEIDFYDIAPCQIRGSFHRCLYKFQFKHQENGMSLSSFCEKYYQNRNDELLEYLASQGRKSYQSLAEYSSLAFGEEVEIDCVQVQEPIMSKICESQIDFWQGETEIGSGQEQLSFQTRTAVKMRRKRIFSTTKDYLGEKYQAHEKNLHENAQKVYSLWQDLLPKLFSSRTHSFLVRQAAQYRRKMIEKTQQSVSSFKGSWDMDMYGEETHLRSKLADQLRNRNNELNQDLNPNPNTEFPVLNQNLFTNKRPIFFEEKSYRPTYLEESLNEEILVILVHGLGACRMDMEKIKIELKRYYEGKIRVFCSSSNEGRTEGDIEAMGMRLASQIDYELNKFTHIPKICMVGHSMGGLIIRSALPRLQKYKRHFHSFVTLSSPHLGYSYSDSKLIDAGLWFMNTVKKCTSLLEMSMKDHQKLEETFLYKLSEKVGLEWFKKVVFLGSHDDHYVPYYSSRIQKHEESVLHMRENVKKGKVHCEMVDRLLEKAKGSITRVDVNFCILEQNLDNFIGRAAHISFINNVEMIRTLVLAGKHYFF